ncbi:related to ATX2-Putative Golgi transporter involved in homeostasis of manganese ions [Phialocephala subalpina]|uniref:Related to ATX2-Putative Golgi transporter involved in homeostasis of manganese ions n=1 Tax=Phialocephala subalpina TaxID=576137 RepID=A0A1L7XXH7_9HELO|nr:related to ATX2-Putative Golgi transporter involved in homeostasis of manganese ions [Phialocephala subalpina]
MLDGLFMLLGLSVVMALASFLAGALPLSMTLSSSQLRLISTIGMGVLVGTSLIVIIPEGIEAIYTSGETGHMHTRRSLQGREFQWVNSGVHSLLVRRDVGSEAEEVQGFNPGPVIPEGLEIKTAVAENLEVKADIPPTTTSPDAQGTAPPKPGDTPPSEEEHHKDPPTFYIGFSLITGFILMFLIDKLPRHASEHITPPPPTRHISLDNLSQGLHSQAINTGDEESESFLQSLAPTPKQSRSLATTTGLVIHAAADGIAMGASASSSNTKLGFIIFIAIMVHKAPAAFGLTSVLLKQGLSKRAARGHLIIFSLAAPFGALTTWIIVNILGGNHMEGEKGQWWTGMLLLFSAGTFLYVAMHAMQEDSNHEHSHQSSNGYVDGGSPQRTKPKPQMRDTLAAVGGMLIPLLTQIGHSH